MSMSTTNILRQPRSGAPGDSPPDATHPWATRSVHEWLRDQWPRLRVEELRLSPVELAAGRRVQLCVHLGALLPADVRVALLPGRPLPLPMTPGPRGHPMWSSRCYHNGCYVFETRLPAGFDDADGVTVHITPRSPAPLERPLRAVTHWLAARASGPVAAPRLTRDPEPPVGPAPSCAARPGRPGVAQEV